MDEIELRTQLEKHHAASFGWALNCCSRNETEAKDVLQNVYMKILNGAARYKGASSFRTWLFSVIRNTAADERRRNWLRRLVLKKYAGECENSHDAGNHGDSSEQGAGLKAFRDSLASLPSRQREVLHLVFYQGMTLEESSEVMRVSIGSARTHYERAKQNLRKMLTGSEVEYGS